MKLTWDDDDPERHRVTRRALTKKEIEEGDFGNYVAGSSAESSDDEGLRARKKGKGKKAERDKLRALLLEGNEDEIPEGWGAEGENDMGDVDMEITFMPALSKKVGEGDETTLERYQRKVREKRKKRKDDRVNGGEVEKGKDEFFEASEGELGGGSDREERKQNRPRKEKIDRNEATAAELALLVAPDKPTDEPKHFNIKSVIKSERSKKRKGRGKKGMDVEEEAQESFVMNVKDERFKALFEDHQFAVDPSNPQYVFSFIELDIY